MQKLLTPQEMADCLGVEKSTIYQWTHQGFIPHIKLGKLVRFREGDVTKWLDSRTQNGRKATYHQLASLLFNQGEHFKFIQTEPGHASAR